MAEAIYLNSKVKVTAWANIKQLLNEADYDVKNAADWEGSW